jgi:hypothetical protein
MFSSSKSPRHESTNAQLRLRRVPNFVWKKKAMLGLHAMLTNGKRTGNARAPTYVVLRSHDFTHGWMAGKETFVCSRPPVWRQLDLPVAKLIGLGCGGGEDADDN